MEMVLICFVVAAFFSVFSLDFILNGSFFSLSRWYFPLFFPSYLFNFGCVSCCFHDCDIHDEGVQILLANIVVAHVVLHWVANFSFWHFQKKVQIDSLFPVVECSLFISWQIQSNGTVGGSEKCLLGQRNMLLQSESCVLFNASFFRRLCVGSLFFKYFFLYVDFTIHGGNFDSRDVLESLTMVVMVVVVQAPKVSPFYFSAS